MDKHYGFIYLTIDLKNGKGYIGQHKIRNQKTLDTQYIGSGKIIRDILKGNGNNKSRFHRQILCLCENQEELDEMEIYYIDYFDAIESENFYNCAEGGKGGNKFANKAVDEMEEIGKKISIKNSGKNNGFFGKHHTYESNKKNSESNKKIWANKSIEEKEEISKKISIKVSGKNNPMYGKNAFANKNEEEMKEISKKMSESHKGEKHQKAKSVYCNELKISFSYTCLAKKYCINILNSSMPNHIADVCNGKNKSTGKLQDGTKLTWNWLEDVDEETLKNATYIDSKKYEELLSQNVNDCK